MNQRTLLTHGVAAVCLAFAGGCAPAETADETDLGLATSAILGLNSLTPAALAPTGSYPTALTPAMLSASALAPGAIAGAALSAIADPGASGTLSRQLLAYAVSCALGPTQAPFTFSWTDASSVVHAESYPGLLGLATDWAGKPLGAAEQPWVSACLIARVNYFGVAVMLSMRGSAAALATTPAEVSAFAYEEGAFWGNVFAASPTAYACDYTPDEAHSEAADRVCATGKDGQGNAVSCGIIRALGSCASYCSALSGSTGQYYPGWSAPAAAGSGTGNAAVAVTVAPRATSLTSQVITVFLQ